MVCAYELLTPPKRLLPWTKDAAIKQISGPLDAAAVLIEAVFGCVMRVVASGATATATTGWAEKALANIAGECGSGELFP